MALDQVKHFNGIQDVKLQVGGFWTNSLWNLIIHCHIVYDKCHQCTWGLHDPLTLRGPSQWVSRTWGDCYKIQKAWQATHTIPFWCIDFFSQSSGFMATCQYPDGCNIHDVEPLCPDNISSVSSFLGRRYASFTVASLSLWKSMQLPPFFIDEQYRKIPWRLTELDLPIKEEVRDLLLSLIFLLETSFLQAC